VLSLRVAVAGRITAYFSAIYDELAFVFNSAAELIGCIIAWEL
jgi:hypothetical protein